jgi:signal transduction histidine kinase
MKKNVICVCLTVLFLVCGFTGFMYAGEAATDEEAMALVEKAGQLIEKEGDAALAVISNPDGGFYFKDKALYAFVYNVDIEIIAHPYKPELIGKSFKGKTDVKGKLFRDEIVRKVLKDGSWWTYYSYEKPGSQNIHTKKTYGKLFKHGDKNYIVCCGVYVD